MPPSLPPSLLLNSKINTGWRLWEKLVNASAAKHRPFPSISPNPAWQFPQHLQDLSLNQESCRNGRVPVWTKVNTGDVQKTLVS